MKTLKQSTQFKKDPKRIQNKPKKLNIIDQYVAIGINPNPIDRVFHTDVIDFNPTHVILN